MPIDLPRAEPLSPSAGGVIAVIVALVGQLLLGLELVGGLAGACDGNPIICGRHPLHLYHATLGATTFRATFDSSCYDPAFQAGCPKTPVFDGGSRPAELALTVAGGRFSPRAYKLGLVAAGVAGPLAFAFAAWGAGTGPAGWLCATLLGIVIWWSEPVRVLLEAGSLDLIGVGHAGLLFVGVLPRYASEPGLRSWALLAFASAAGWYAHPVIWLGLFPVGVLYYAAVAPRQGLAWHLGQVAAFLVGLGVNLWWLSDWVRFWWLRQTAFDDLSSPSWHAVLGVAADYADIPGPGLAAWIILALGSFGLIACWRGGKRVVVGVVVAAALLAVIFARLGRVWPALEALSAGRAGTFAVGVFAIPAAQLLADGVRRLPNPFAAIAGLSVLPLAGVILGMGVPAELPAGLNPDRRELVAALRHETTPEARILWEDPDHLTDEWDWSALLPELTGRAYLGGLDPDAGVEHSFVSLRGGKLNGRPFADWTAVERSEFLTRYNVGWVVTRTPAAVGWWLSDPRAKVVGHYRDGVEVTLIAINRPKSFVLSGHAIIERADRTKIVLADAVPDAEGRVVLSYHYQPGFVASPGPVTVAADKDVYDPVPMLAVRLTGPTSRVVLVWTGR